MQQAINDVTIEIKELETTAAAIVAKARAADDDNAIVEWAAIDARLRFSRVYLAHLGVQQEADRARRVVDLGKQISDAEIKEFEADVEGSAAETVFGVALKMFTLNPNSKHTEADVEQARQELNDARIRLTALEKQRHELIKEFKSLGGMS